MGQCTNHILREHQAILSTSPSGHLAVHCARCDGDPLFHRTCVLGMHWRRVARNVVQAYHIQKAASSVCISAPSFALFEEICFLDQYF